MLAKQFGWAAKTSETSLSAILKDIVQNWYLRWQMQGTSEGVKIECQGKREGLVARGDGGSVALSLSQSDAASLAKLFSGISVGLEQPMEKLLGERAMHDLIEQIMLRAGNQTPINIDNIAWPQSSFDSRLGSAICSLVTGALEFDIAVDRQLLKHLVGFEASTPFRNDSGLFARMVALGNTEIGLEVVLDFGEAGIEHITNLKSGDVLVTDKDLTSPALIRIHGGRDMAYGKVAEKSGNLAVTLQDVVRQH